MPFMAPLLALSPLRDIFFTYCYYPSYGMRAHVLYEHVDPYGPIVSRDAYMRTYGRKDAIATRLPRTGAVVLVDRVPLLDDQACADAKVLASTGRSLNVVILPSSPPSRCGLTTFSLA